jgi:hypothetical protein
MASNFRIAAHRSSDSVSIKLYGDFDGSSAYQLIEHLKKDCRSKSKVFIDTCCLREIHAFGKEVFEDSLSKLNRDCICLVFSGKNAAKLAPPARPGPGRRSGLNPGSGERDLR